jgi:exodeoxyribonuclease VII large subunit
LNGIPYIKLSELTQKIEFTIKQSVGAATWWIVAEISGHKYYPSQERHYFEFIEKTAGLAEPVARLRGVSWRNSAQAIRHFEMVTGQKFTSGVQVLANVKLEFHPSYGLTLVLIGIDHSFTLGNLEKQRRETLLRLVAENPESIQQSGEEFITWNKKIVLPLVFHRVAVIGSQNSEGLTDFMHTISSNQFGYQFSIDIYPSSVQGATAEKELVSRLVTIFLSGKKYDAVVIIRGGGSRTDFLVFDSYELAKAVAKFPVPVITGIGHHKDVSIVDLMANASTKTPTRAAEFIISHNRTFEDAVLALQTTVVIKAQQLLAQDLQGIQSFNAIIINRSFRFISRDKDNLNQLNQVIINKTKAIIYTRQTKLVSLLNQLLSKPKIITAGRVGELAHMSQRLKSTLKQFIFRQDHLLKHYSTLINLMDPVQLLKKGFALIIKNGRIIKDGEMIAPGNDVNIAMHDYTIKTSVISKSKTDATNANL